MSNKNNDKIHENKTTVDKNKTAARWTEIGRTTRKKKYSYTYQPSYHSKFRFPRIICGEKIVRKTIKYPTHMRDDKHFFPSDFIYYYYCLKLIIYHQYIALLNQYISLRVFKHIMARLVFFLFFFPFRFRLDWHKSCSFCIRKAECLRLYKKNIYNFIALTAVRRFMCITVGLLLETWIFTQTYTAFFRWNCWIINR